MSQQLMNIEISGGRIVDPSQGIDTDANLYIADGKVLAIGQRPSGFTPQQQVDASGCLVLPGLVDLCASLRSAQRASLQTETRAAVKGGVTSLCCPPDSGTINDSGAVTSLLREQAQQTGLARVFPIGAMTQGLKGEQLAEMYGLKQAGCRMVSNLRYPMKNNRVLRRCMEYAHSQSMALFFNAEDASLAADGCVHEGFISTRLGLNGIPELAETLAVAQLLLLAEETGARVHFAQLSTARAVEMIAQAQQKGLQVSADVAIANLLLTEDVVDAFDSRYHLKPPLRSVADREALRQGVRDGVIQAICSQHQPHEVAAKQAPFAETAPGIVGLETLLPLTLQLVAEKVFSLPQAIAALTAGPAAVLGEPLGTLRPGTAADLCVLDPQAQWTLSEDTLLSAGKNSPFMGQALAGMVRHTWVGGRCVYGECLTR